MNEEYKREVEGKLLALYQRVENLTARQNFLKEIVSKFISGSIEVNVEKLDVKEGDVVVFSLPESYNYDDYFFNAVSKIFDEKKISAIAIQNGITLSILEKSDEKKTETET